MFNTAEIDGLVLELLDEVPTSDVNSISFTERAVELIHEIGAACSVVPIVQKYAAQSGQYGNGLNAEDVYSDMIRKMANAPTKLHMEMTIIMMIPIISKKLKERGE